MKSIAHLLMVIFLFGLSSCIDGPEYPIEPVIKFSGLSKNFINQSSLREDTLEIYIDYTDGDGDIGSPSGSSDIYLIDSRLGVVQDSFRAPEVPKKGTKNGIDGTITIQYFSTCCIFPDGSPPCYPSTEYPTDSLQLIIYIKDRARHESNSVTTDWITLYCN